MDTITEIPYPDVVITNGAFAHTQSDLYTFQERFGSEIEYWKSLLANISQGNNIRNPSPKYLIHQNAMYMMGKKRHSSTWTAGNRYSTTF